MKRNLLFFFGLIALMCSCSPKISTKIYKQHDALSEHTDVAILGMEDAQPESAELLGVLQISSRGSSPKDCFPHILFEKAKTEARKIGGNTIKVHQYLLNTNGCPNIKANIVKIANSEQYTSSSIPNDADYALLHVYRPSGAGFAVNYDLHLDSAVIARSSNNWRETIKIEKAGAHSLWARTETTIDVPLNIQFGKEYYVRSGVTMGAFIGRPFLGLMDNTVGRVEFQSIKTKVNYSSVRDTTNDLNYSNDKRFRVAISAGLGYRTAKYPEGATLDEISFLKQLKTGFQAELAMNYFFGKWFGIGVKYSEFLANADNGYQSWQREKITEKTRTTFVGPFFTYRLFDKKERNCLLLDYGLGYLGYRASAVSMDQSLTLKGKTVGLFMNFGYDVWLSEYASLGFQLTLSGGKISEFTDDFGRSVKLPDGQSEGLGRIDFSIGLRF